MYKCFSVCVCQVWHFPVFPDFMIFSFYIEIRIKTCSGSLKVSCLLNKRPHFPPKLESPSQCLLEVGNGLDYFERKFVFQNTSLITTPVVSCYHKMDLKVFFSGACSTLHASSCMWLKPLAFRFVHFRLF